MYEELLAICKKTCGNLHSSTQNTAIGLWNVLQKKVALEVATHGRQADRPMIKRLEAQMTRLDTDHNI